MNRPWNISALRLSRPRRWQWITTTSILLLAAVPRFWGLGRESAWIDEAYSLVLAKHSVAEIIRGTAADQHPPLYYLLLHFWLMLGSSVGFARLLSAAIGVIHVGQTLSLGRKLGGEAIGL